MLLCAAFRTMSDALPPAFPTIYGRGLLGEIKNIAAPRYVIVTMRDLWAMPAFRSEFPAEDGGNSWCTYFVESLENDKLMRDIKAIAALSAEPLRCVVGLGGGQAIDVAKLFAWSLGLMLFQVPTALTVDAPWGHRAAVRFDGHVKYIGFATPAAIYIDYDIMQRAPKRLIVSGAMDVLCFATAQVDWKLASIAGKSTKYPYDQAIVDAGMKHVHTLLHNVHEIRNVTEKGIQVMCEAFKHGGNGFHAYGWNPRPLEGVDHLGFYALEARTRRAFIHGQAVGLFIFLGALLQSERAEMIPDSRSGRDSVAYCDGPGILSTIIELGIDIRPEALGITWDDVQATLLDLRRFAVENNHFYTIVNEVDVTEKFCESARGMLYAAYDSFRSV